MQISRVDCHFHTTKSDGRYSPERAAAEARRAGLDFASPTNHDILDSETVEALRSEWIESVPGVEISACEYGEGGKKSLHVTAFSNRFDAPFETVLASVREARVRKVRGQIDKLAASGFDIRWTDFETYWTERGIGIDNASNAHVRAFLFPEDGHDPERHAGNVRKYEEITGERFDVKTFISRHLKRESDAPFGYFPIPDYEPGYDVLASVRERCDAVLSIAHPNCTFQKEGIRAFETHALRALGSGAVNALEIHSSTPPEWIAKILEIRNRTGALLTFGSDCHFKPSYDGKHAWIGELNPHVGPELVAAEFARFRKFLDAGA